MLLSGYLPAEHIETPTERLARLNKHRNIDVRSHSNGRPFDEIGLTIMQLAATMLGDNAERSKNPLRKAMRRRNAKTVQFSDPTYYEASDIDYSTEEDDEAGQDGEGNGRDGEAEPNEVQRPATEDRDEITAVEPVRAAGPNAENRPDLVPRNERAAEPNEAQERPSTEDSHSIEETADRSGKCLLCLRGSPIVQ